MHVLTRTLREYGAALLELLLPRQCAGCQKTWLHKHQGFWCEACRRELCWIESPICPRCGRPFPKSPSSADHLCGDCLQSAFLFDTARSATQHSGVVRRRIHQLKFGGQLHWVPPLADLLCQLFRGGEPSPVPPTLSSLFFQQGPDSSFRIHHSSLVTAEGPAVELVLPVPLHVKRLRQRGFNQAGLLAREFGRRLGLPVLFHALVRKIWTEPQTRLNREERLRNVRDAFHVMDVEAVKDRRILIVDDVFTTGTTLNECAKTLKASGASEVHALTVCRALPDWKTEYENAMG